MAALRKCSATIEIAHNAGALLLAYQTDDRGRELTLSSHLVGPYLLTKLLTPRLTSGARVIFMSSGGMYTQRLDVQRLEMSEQSYKRAVAYARATRSQGNFGLTAKLDAPAMCPEQEQPVENASSFSVGSTNRSHLGCRSSAQDPELKM